VIYPTHRRTPRLCRTPAAGWAAPRTELTLAATASSRRNSYAREAARSSAPASP